MPTNSAGRNHKRTKESSLFGTRKLAFYTVTANPEQGLVGNFTSGYSFRVSTLTGLVTLDANITAKNIAQMTDENTGEIDDDYVTLTLPFDIEVFGGGLTDTIYVSSNSGISFYNGNSSTPDPDQSGNIGEPAIQIASNDGNLQFLYTDDSVTGEYRVKFRGNTDYNNETVVNLVWEALFREGEDYIDFLVTAQPTDWAAYDDGQGNVTWGVTNGNSWVDGRTIEERGTSFAPFQTIGEELWRLPNSTYYKVVQAIQQSGAEIFWLGTPHNAAELFQVDWSGLTIADDWDSFMFAIADDADTPIATLSNTTTGTVIATATATEDSIDLDGNYSNVYKGQRVTFSGTTFGGIIAGQDYFVVDIGNYDAGSKMWITVSETADPEVLDIVYPTVVGGEPGPAFVTTTATGSMTATFYNYNIEWGGTAGDSQSACCDNITEPGILPSRLMFFISESGALATNNDNFFWLTRANPTNGIFPAYLINGAL